MNALYLWTANAIVIVHILVALFIVVGWYFREVQIVYLIVLISWPLSWAFLGYCPLTKWELLLRKKLDPSIDPHTEKIHYMMQKYFGVNLPERPIYIGGMVCFLFLLALSIAPNFL